MLLSRTAKHDDIVNICLTIATLGLSSTGTLPEHSSYQRASLCSGRIPLVLQKQISLWPVVLTSILSNRSCSHNGCSQYSVYFMIISAEAISSIRLWNLVSFRYSELARQYGHYYSVDWNTGLDYWTDIFFGFYPFYGWLYGILLTFRAPVAHF